MTFFANPKKILQSITKTSKHFYDSPTFYPHASKKAIIITILLFPLYNPIKKSNRTTLHYLIVPEDVILLFIVVFHKLHLSTSC